MPAIRNPGPNARKRFVECDICHIVIANAGDMPRHKKLHNPEQHLLHCPYDECIYTTLQKGNMNTHISSKHELVKTACTYQGCNFKSTQRGYVLRHMKRTHGYKPKKMTAKDTKAAILERARERARDEETKSSLSQTPPPLSPSLDSSPLSLSPGSLYSASNSSSSDLSVSIAPTYGAPSYTEYDCPYSTIPDTDPKAVPLANFLAYYGHNDPAAESSSYFTGSYVNTVDALRKSLDLGDLRLPEEVYWDTSASLGRDTLLYVDSGFSGAETAIPLHFDAVEVISMPPQQQFMPASDGLDMVSGNPNASHSSADFMPFNSFGAFPIVESSFSDYTEFF
ncbi:hypothetical protein FA95DRAFT_1571808 [Auriscalpium vulgare]|uniref:Uncharacterized protein n=1 Tax=Auriscalpium vulgare TaxID=40419 RepID=A0ACB8RWX7_9AGAM|nr:hypothetical protein FA95DRAFT_1571808 [Auriscalpium vulgare]